ncbi:MAG: hypothetical protein ACP5VQ_03430 [Phycisphaerae bacterium]
MQFIIVYYVACMLMQTTTCKRGKATYFTYLVRQSFRTPKGTRVRTVCNVTKLSPHIRKFIAQWRLILQRYKSSRKYTWLTDEAFQEPYF